MSNYHQLLNQLTDLNLTCVKENLPAHLDEVAKSDKSLVEKLKPKENLETCNVSLS